jgi:hypothetical protein
MTKGFRLLSDELGSARYLSLNPQSRETWVLIYIVVLTPEGESLTFKGEQITP